MTTPTPIQDLHSVADELAEKWDAGMKAGKLLAAMEGRITNYDPRVSRIIAVLTAASSPQQPSDTGDLDRPVASSSGPNR